jgi:hypothetical protein
MDISPNMWIGWRNVSGITMPETDTAIPATVARIMGLVATAFGDQCWVTSCCPIRKWKKTG